MHPLGVEGAFLTITHAQKTIGCIGARMGDFCLRKFGIEWLVIIKRTAGKSLYTMLYWRYELK